MYHKSEHWQFKNNFKPGVFRSWNDGFVQRLKIAVKEIEDSIDEYDYWSGVNAAEGSIWLIESIPKSIENYQGSTTAIEKSINRAIQTLKDIIIDANVNRPERKIFVKRIWQVIKNSDYSVIEGLVEYLGIFCIRSELASEVYEELAKGLNKAIRKKMPDRIIRLYTRGCLSTLFSATRFSELMLFLDTNHLNEWEFRRWGVKVLVAEKRIDDALTLALSSKGSLYDKYDIAETCESILIKNGRRDEAYKRFAFKVNQNGSFEKTCKKIYKKYSIPIGKIKMDYQFYDIDSPYFDPTEE